MADMPRPDSSPTDSALIADREFVLLLISLYRDCPELWDVKSKYYLNKNKRNMAIQKILKVLKIYKPQYNEETFKRKINTLRTNFNKEWQKIDRKKKSGASIDEIPEPSLWYFNELTFIKDQVEKADTESSEGSLTEVLSRPPSDVTLPIPMKKKKQSSSSNTNQCVDLASSYFKEPVNESEIIAKGWAIKLNRLTQDQRRYAEKIINDTLFEAEMGTLTRNGVVFLSSSSPSLSMSPAPPISASETHSHSDPASHSSYSTLASRLSLCENKNIKKE